MSEHQEAQKQADYRAGVVAALVANSIPRKKKTRAAKPEDFFPSLKRRGGE